MSKVHGEVVKPTSEDAPNVAGVEAVAELALEEHFSSVRQVPTTTSEDRHARGGSTRRSGNSGAEV